MGYVVDAANFLMIFAHGSTSWTIFLSSHFLPVVSKSESLSFNLWDKFSHVLRRRMDHTNKQLKLEKKINDAKLMGARRGPIQINL